VKGGKPTHETLFAASSAIAEKPSFFILHLKISLQVRGIPDNFVQSGRLSGLDLIVVHSQAFRYTTDTDPEPSLDPQLHSKAAEAALHCPSTTEEEDPRSTTLPTALGGRRRDCHFDAKSRVAEATT